MPYRKTGALAAAAAALLAAGPLAAQQPRTITFSEALSIALEQNASLRLARNAAALDSVTVTQARKAFLPDLRFNTSTAGSVARSEDSFGSNASQSLSAGVSTSVVVFDGNANRAALAGARLAEQAGARDVERAGQSVVFTVASNFLALVEQQEQLRVRREALAAQQAQLTQIEAFVQAGNRPIADLYQQQASVAAARLAIVEAERAVALAEVELIQTLQLDPRGEYEFQPPPVAADAAGGPTTAALDALLERAFAQRPDLAARQAELAAAQQGIREARAARLPQVTVSAGYDTNYNSSQDVAFLEQIDRRSGGSVAVGVSVPILDRGNARASTQRAQIAVDNARIALENQRQQVGLEVRRATLDLQSARERLAAAEAQLRAAELALQATQERYQAGVGTMLELTQARAVRVEAESAVVAARYNLVFQRTLIDYYVGELDPQGGVTLGVPAGS